MRNWVSNPTKLKLKWKTFNHKNICVFNHGRTVTTYGNLKYSGALNKEADYFNSLWPSGVLWLQKAGSILAQVMACCLMAQRHQLNQCSQIISEVQRHSSDIHLMGWIPWYYQRLWFISLECCSINVNIEPADDLGMSLPRTSLGFVLNRFFWGNPVNRSKGKLIVA